MELYECENVLDKEERNIIMVCKHTYMHLRRHIATYVYIYFLRIHIHTHTYVYADTYFLLLQLERFIEPDKCMTNGIFSSQ